MTWICIAIIVLATTVGEVMQALGMRRHIGPSDMGRVGGFNLEESVGRELAEILANSS